MRYELFERLQDGRVLNFMRGDLAQVLYEVLPAGVEIRFGCTVDAVEQRAGEVVVRLSEGAREAADLLVGADGVHSRVRALVFGAEDRFVHDLGYQTAAFTVTDPALRQELDGSFRMVAAPKRLAGLYPIREGKVASFFVHQAAASGGAACEELGRMHRNLGWRIPDALAHCGRNERIYYDRIAQVRMPYWHVGRVVLVGDACQAVSLLAGQGASMAVAGAAVLAEELGGEGSVEARLARYQARLKPVIEEKQAAGRRAAKWFVPASRWRLVVRNLALRVASLPRMEWLLRPVLAAESGRL
jgi:2-polyprenyl-6-methoxyphenol hydroxylase-like FAD-dependent oxidoreductase